MHVYIHTIEEDEDVMVGLGSIGCLRRGVKLKHKLHVLRGNANQATASNINIKIPLRLSSCDVMCDVRRWSKQLMKGIG